MTDINKHDKSDVNKSLTAKSGHDTFPVKHGEYERSNDAEADKRLIGVIVFNALALLGCIAILIGATSCQQALKMKGAMTLLQAKGERHD